MDSITLFSLILLLLLAYRLQASPANPSNSVSVYSSNSASITLPSGYASYIFGCAGGDFTINSTSWPTTVSAPTGPCSPENTCVSMGYQASAQALCTFSRTDEGVIAGIALNSSIQPADVFSASGMNTTTLSYRVQQSNSTVAIIGGSAWYGSETALPFGCVQQLNTHSNNSYASVSIALCRQSAGTYNITLSPPSPLNTPTTVAIAAYVLPGSASAAISSTPTTILQTNRSTVTTSAKPTSTTPPSTTFSNATTIQTSTIPGVTSITPQAQPAATVAQPNSSANQANPGNAQSQSASILPTVAAAGVAVVVAYVVLSNLRGGKKSN